MAEANPIRPEGIVRLSYSPMSPPSWDLWPFEFHVFVYKNVATALDALIGSIDKLRAERIRRPRPWLNGETLYYRGQSDVSDRLLPTLLRSRAPRAPRQRFGNGASAEARQYWGDWVEEDPEFRQVETTFASLPAASIAERRKAEETAIAKASTDARLGDLSAFQKRAAVRHYAGVPSGLLDVSTDPEVAAFFATGGGKPAETGSIGMLWAIDLNFLNQFLSTEVSVQPGGFRVRLSDSRADWGDNAKMLEDYGMPPARFDFTATTLPLPRPTNQRGRFIAIEPHNGAAMSLKAEIAWWSVFERWAYQVAFLHDGKTYENPAKGISAKALFPAEDPFASGTLWK